jgi:hypothetical protein
VIKLLLPEMSQKKILSEAMMVNLDGQVDWVEKCLAD